MHLRRHRKAIFFAENTLRQGDGERYAARKPATLGPQVNMPLYIESLPRTRAKPVGVALMSMTLAIAFDHWVKPKRASIAALPTCEALPYVRAELIAGILLAWIIGFVALKQGTKARKENQAPMAGLGVVAHTS